MTGKRRRGRRRARAPRRLAGVAAVLVVLLALVGAGAWWAGRGTGSSAAGSPPAAAQTTLLVDVAGAGTAESALLAYATDSRQATEVLLPAGVLASVPGAGTQPIGQVLATAGGGGLGRATVADLLNVRVDGSWTLGEDTLAALVDRVGGVVVDVDTDVVRSGPGGRSTVVVGAGRQRLDGRQAVAFATYQAAGEDAAARLARLQSVLDATVSAMPRDTGQLSALLRSLGSGSTLSLPADRAARFLTSYAAAVRGNRLVAQVLPVVPIDSGGATRYRPDTEAVRELVRTRLAGAARPTGQQQTRIYVENAVGTPGLGRSVRDRLVAAGFTVVGDSNLTPFGRASSSVLVPDDSKASVSIGQRVAKVLGLPASAVAVSTRGQSVADVIVIIGRDYRP